MKPQLKLEGNIKTFQTATAVKILFFFLLPTQVSLLPSYRGWWSVCGVRHFEELFNVSLQLSLSILSDKGCLDNKS